MRESIPTYWFSGSEFRSLFFDAGSVAIPPAERFVQETMRYAQVRITNNELLHDLETLCSDEELHSKVHDSYNTLLQERGLRFQRFQKFDVLLGRFFSRFDLRTRLAVCAAIEHLTALMAKYVLESKYIEEENVHESVRMLWLWHASEEVGHRSTTLRVYRALGGGYMRRACVFLAVSFIYAVTTSLLLFALMQQQRLSGTWRIWRDGGDFLFGSKGMYRSIAGGWARFLVFTFNPQTDPCLAAHVSFNQSALEKEVISRFA